MSDLSAALAISLARAGHPAGVIFTERQLYFELCRTLARPTLGYRLQRTPLWRWLPPAPAPLSLAQFRSALAQASAQADPLAGLLPAAALTAPALRVPVAEPDALAYGLPRLLVCESAAVAAMLRANLFHLELGCITLSWAEASPLPAPLVAMLMRAPAARVFLLHDASPAGLALLAEPASRLGLPAGLHLVDLGLRPRQAWQGHLLAERQPPPATAWRPPTLTAAEHHWLDAGWTASVEAINPAQLLRGLRRALLATTARAATRATTARQLGFMTWPASQ